MTPTTFSGRTATLLALLVTGLLLAVPLTAVAAHAVDHARGPPAGTKASAHAEAGKSAGSDKRAAMETFQATRAAVLDEYRATTESIRASFFENRSRVLDECRPQRSGGDAPSNLSAEDRRAYAHCIRDGLKDLREDARAELREAHSTARAALKHAARDIAASMRGGPAAATPAGDEAAEASGSEAGDDSAEESTEDPADEAHDASDSGSEDESAENSDEAESAEDESEEE